MRMCGRPAVPNISARPSDTASIGLDTSLPGASTSGPYWLAAVWKSSSGLKSNFASTITASTRRARQQQHRLDDLHPRGGDHPAEEHVEDHHHAHDADGHLVGQAEHHADEVAGAHHLGDQVEAHHGERAHRGRDAHRRLLQPVGHHVREGVLAQVAQRLGDEERHHRPAHQPAHRVDEAVEAGERHQAGDAQEARGAHVVAGEREAVLEARSPLRPR